jgi:5-formyltetrahydrofolate cyclo-ligase
MASEDLPANGHGGPADPTVAVRANPTKAELRRELRAARAAFVATLGPAERAALNTTLADVLADHLPPGIVAAYCAVGAEIDPSALARPVALPRAVRGQPLTFHAASRSECRPSRFGVPEPAADAPAVVPDIVLVPLLGVDPRGIRIGYGGGFYDRTLATLRAKRRVLAVGVAWEMQRIGALPADPWDERLDALATPSGWVDFTR